MNCTGESDIEREEIEIENLIASGAPIASMRLYDILENNKLLSLAKNKIDYTYELYMELFNKFRKYDDAFQMKYLNALKNADIVDNQSLEKEDSFLTSMKMNFETTFAIDELIKSDTLTKEDFVRIHDMLIEGSSSESKTGFRTNNLTFIGTYNENPTSKYFYENRDISYFPIRYTEIPEAVDKFLNLYNETKQIEDYYQAFLIPMVYHGLIASLQLFRDGNTRYARLIQNVELYKLLNKTASLNLQLPIVYPTRQYTMYRGEYRHLIENIVLNNNIESWEEWFKFNLNRIQDGLIYNDMCLDKLKLYSKSR